MTDLSNIFDYLKIEIDIDLNKKIISLQWFIYLKKIFGQYDISNYKLVKIFIYFGDTNSFTLYENQEKKNIVA